MKKARRTEKKEEENLRGMKRKENVRKEEKNMKRNEKKGK